MERSILEIPIDELAKNVIKSARSCKFAPDGCEMVSRRAMLRLDFKNYPEAIGCSIHMRRTSGNGHILVSFGGSCLSAIVNSKSNEEIVSEIGPDHQLLLSRPHSSIGDVKIIGVSLLCDDGKILEDGVMIWRDVLSKCLEYKGISIVKGRLFATSGAVIKADKIEKVVTIPANMCDIGVGDTEAKFAGSCEVTSLELSGERKKQTCEIILKKIAETPNKPDLSSLYLENPAQAAFYNFDLPRNGTPLGVYVSSDNISSLFDYTKDAGLNDRVKKISKKFAILPRNNYVSEKRNISGRFNLLSCGSKFWFNKVSSGFDGLSAISNGMVLNGNSSGEVNLAICSVDMGPKEVCKRIFLEEFNDDSVVPDLLGKSEVIFTPSVPNMHKLKETFTDTKVMLEVKPWPAIPEIVRESRNKYFVYFEKHPAITQMIYDSWNAEKYGGLYVVGVRHKVPDFAKYISEYETYDNLYRILVNSFGVIDMASNKHYLSGIINLSLALGLNVVTNNHAYSLKTDYIVRNSSIEGKNYIEKDDFTRVMDSCIRENVERQQLDMKEYNLAAQCSILRLVS